MTQAPLLSCTRPASCGIWPGKCLSYSYQQRSKWWGEPFPERGSACRRRVWAWDWAASRRSRWPTGRSGPGPTTPTWSWRRTTAGARPASRSTGGRWCARAGTSRFWVRCGRSTTSAPPAVASGRQTGQCDCCQRSWGAREGGGCAWTGRRQGPSPHVRRRARRGHRSCSTRSCWSLLSTGGQDSRGCRPHFPRSHCPGQGSSPGSRGCSGRPLFCHGAKKQNRQLLHFCHIGGGIVLKAEFYLCTSWAVRMFASGKSGKEGQTPREHFVSLMCKLMIITSRCSRKKLNKAR